MQVEPTPWPPDSPGRNHGAGAQQSGFSQAVQAIQMRSQVWESLNYREQKGNKYRKYLTLSHLGWTLGLDYLHLLKWLPVGLPAGFWAKENGRRRLPFWPPFDGPPSFGRRENFYLQIIPSPETDLGGSLSLQEPPPAPRGVDLQKWENDAGIAHVKLPREPGALSLTSWLFKLSSLEDIQPWPRTFLIFSEQTWLLDEPLQSSKQEGGHGPGKPGAPKILAISYNPRRMWKRKKPRINWNIISTTKAHQY